LLALRVERRLRVFENRVLRRIFGLKRDERTGKWRRLRNEELYAVVRLSNYYSGDQIKNTEIAWACSTYGEE
jgi:hypothetical protein